MTEDRNCPQCNAMMEYRLGEYQCPDCGHAESSELLKGATAKPRSTAATIQNYDPQAGAPSGFIHGYRNRVDEGEKYDPSPTLDNEKLMLMGVFVVQAIINIAGSVGPGTTGPIGTMGAQLLYQGIGLLFLAIVFFAPIMPLKWVCATLSCFSGVLGLVGLVFGLLAVTLMASPEGLLAWLGSVLNVGVNLWIASVLYRDIQKMQL